MNSKEPKPSSEQIQGMSAELFRGQTDFAALSPADKLRWLSQAAAFVALAKKLRDKQST